LLVKREQHVVTAYRTYKQSFTGDKGTTRSINVSAISASTGNQTSDRENKIGEKEDGYDQSKDYSNYHVKPRFYKTGEWNSLKRGERNYLRTVSMNKSNKSYANKDCNRDDTKLKRKNKHLIAKVASLQAFKAKSLRKLEGNTSDTEESEDEPIRTPSVPRKKRTKVVSIKRG
jgi:hypothetical protein